MKINYKYTKENLLLHPSSEDLFYYFDYDSLDEYKYINIQYLVDRINNLDENFKIYKDVLLDKKLLCLELEDAPQYNCSSVFYFEKEEIDDLLEELLTISYHKHKRLFNFLRKEIKREMNILNLFNVN